MRKFAVIDCETDPAKHGRVPQPFIWGYYDGQTYKQFDDFVDLIHFLFDRDEIVYAHNGGKFDFHFILDLIEPFSPVTIISGRIAKFNIGEAEFRDSINIIPTALDNFQKMEFDYTILEKEVRDLPHNRKKIEEYLHSDCVNLYNLVAAFIDRFGINLTVAGTALKQWQGISGLTPPHDSNGELYEEFKAYYYGGRCQAFETGVIEDDFSMVDINSAYPYAMLHKHNFSTSYIEVDSEYWHSLYKSKNTNEAGCALITVICCGGGSLPYRSIDGSLFFPDDGEKRTYYVTGWELMAGIETGAIQDYKITRCVCFDELIDFSDYINYFYEERKIAKEVGDKANNIFCKLMMNSLYGKFGSNPDNYNSYMTVEPDSLDGEFYHDYDQSVSWTYAGPFGSNALVAKDLEGYEQNFYNIATAASITGFVRAFMWRAISSCDGVIYCDTDSIAARSIGDLPNGIGKELGQWEIEGHFKRGAVGGRKLYAFQYKGRTTKYKTASKGVKLTPRQLFRVARGGEVVYKNDFPVFSVHKEPHFIDRTVKMVKKELQE